MQLFIELYIIYAGKNWQQIYECAYVPRCFFWIAVGKHFFLPLFFPWAPGKVKLANQWQWNLQLNHQNKSDITWKKICKFSQQWTMAVVRKGSGGSQWGWLKPDIMKLSKWVGFQRKWPFVPRMASSTPTSHTSGICTLSTAKVSDGYSSSDNRRAGAQNALQKLRCWSARTLQVALCQRAEPLEGGASLIAGNQSL